MREHVKIMFREEEVNQRIQEVADQINRDYGDTPLHLHSEGRRDVHV